MNKKDKEQTELNRLLQECIREQKDVGLIPKDNIEVYFDKDPITGEKSNKTSSAFAMSEDGRNCIIIKKSYFKKMPTKEIKRLLHHELIHLNATEKDKTIEHKKDWQMFMNLSNKFSFLLFFINNIIFELNKMKVKQISKNLNI